MKATSPASPSNAVRSPFGHPLRPLSPWRPGAPAIVGQGPLRPLRIAAPVTKRRLRKQPGQPVASGLGNNLSALPAIPAPACRPGNIACGDLRLPSFLSHGADARGAQVKATIIKDDCNRGRKPIEHPASPAGEPVLAEQLLFALCGLPRSFRRGGANGCHILRRDAVPEAFLRGFVAVRCMRDEPYDDYQSHQMNNKKADYDATASNRMEQFMQVLKRLFHL